MIQVVGRKNKHIPQMVVYIMVMYIMVENNKSPKKQIQESLLRCPWYLVSGL